MMQKISKPNTNPAKTKAFRQIEGTKEQSNDYIHCRPFNRKFAKLSKTGWAPPSVNLFELKSDLRGLGTENCGRTCNREARLEYAQWTVVNPNDASTKIFGVKIAVYGMSRQLVSNYLFGLKCPVKNERLHLRKTVFISQCSAIWSVGNQLLSWVCWRETSLSGSKLITPPTIPQLKQQF